MTPHPYTQKTDDEIDVMCAKVAAIDLILNPIGPGIFFHDEEGLIREWNPTSPDSAQCERYLFPKLYDKGWRIHQINSGQGFRTTIKKHTQGVLVDEVGENLNRTRCIAALMALDAIEKG